MKITLNTSTGEVVADKRMTFEDLQALDHMIDDLWKIIDKQVHLPDNKELDLLNAINREQNS